VPPGRDPEALLHDAIARGERVMRFEIADPSIERIFVEHVGETPTMERTLAAPVALADA
jgi:ABC-type uncharacterized transport system ATPase subunit